MNDDPESENSVDSGGSMALLQLKIRCNLKLRGKKVTSLRASQSAEVGSVSCVDKEPVIVRMHFSVQFEMHSLEVFGLNNNSK